jgi:hypothetical protein
LALGALHIGQPTDAATHFLEVREQYLPTGYSLFSTLESDRRASQFTSLIARILDRRRRRLSARELIVCANVSISSPGDEIILRAHSVTPAARYTIAASQHHAMLKTAGIRLSLRPAAVS